MNSNQFLAHWTAILLVSLLPQVQAEIPAMLSHQGRIAVDGVNFDGDGQFKFALVSGDGATTYWSNDGASVAGSQPLESVTLAVIKGLYSVLLGDVALTNMSALPDDLFENQDVRLRLWFNDGGTGFQQLSPDQRLAAAPYALATSTVHQVALSSIIAPPNKPVIAWGQNHGGQTMPALANVSAIAAGETHSLALLKNGTVETWDDGPQVPSDLTEVTDIAAGSGFSLACKSNGTVIAWGDDTYGQTTITNNAGAVAVAAGDKHSLVLHADGTLSAQGNNTFGQTIIPTSASPFTAIACGYDHSLALKADGTVVAWGRDNNGQATVPDNLTDVIAIAAGAFHSLAVKSDGTIAAWGWNEWGQRTIPDGLTDIENVAGGYAFSLALKNDGSLVAWGDNTNFQLDIPESATQISAIAAGATHALALRTGTIPAMLARLNEENVFTDKIGIGRTPAVNMLEVEGQASKSTAGHWASNSDRRIKTDIQPVTNALEKLEQVRLVDFRYTEAYRAAHPGIGNKRYLNVIAQEFAEVFPDHVHGSGEGFPDGSEILQVDTYPLTIYSAAAVRELHEKLKVKDRQIAVLTAQNETQSQRLITLEAKDKARESRLTKIEGLLHSRARPQ